MVSIAYKYRLGHPLLESSRELHDLPTNMRQLHEYYMIDTKSGEYSGFEALILPKVVFNRPLHRIGYDCLFQLFNRCDLDNQIMMLWTL
jgi:5-formyltetrahydrofolate cyclo-ligase